MSNGSYVRQNGKPVLSSLSKKFVYAGKEGDSLSVQLEGQSIIKAWLGVDKRGQLKVNGTVQPIKFDRDGLVQVVK